MKIDRINKKLIHTLKQFKKNDSYLIEKDGSERSMAHRIAFYLEMKFPTYDIDCEYNINVDSDDGRKNIYLLNQEIEKYKNSMNLEDREFKVYPDIIVHKRGSNNHNLLIIEIKKSTSRVPFNYDYLKLQKYTDNLMPKGLKYKYGVFVEIENNDNITIQYFENGNKI